MSSVNFGSHLNRKQGIREFLPPFLGLSRNFAYLCGRKERLLMRKIFIIAVCLCAMAGGLQAGNRQKGLKPNEMAEARTRVWAAWCREQAEHDRQDGLAALGFPSLAEPALTRWQLPDSLEPKAVMPFYSGTKGERPAEGYPLYIYQHGSGPKDIEWANGLRLAQGFEDSPSAYVIPQIPNEGKYYRWWQQSKQWAWDRLFRQMLVHPDINPARIYLFGISEGGYGSQRLASFYADYLAAAAPMAGGEPLRNAPAENLSHLPFSLVTGEQDAMFYRNRLTLRTGERLDSLAREYPGEFPHRVELEAGRGHGITYGVSTPWMSRYTREALPRHFRWENYEMDGLRRNAFYNLQVLTDDTLRYDYEFRVEDNTVWLDVRQVEYTITERDPNWGIELDNTRSYQPRSHGQVRIWLSEELVDLGRKVTVVLNGRRLGAYRLKPDESDLQASCRLFGDPLRLFPAHLDVEW